MGNHLFVDFARELELLAGLRRQNADILESIKEYLIARKPQRLRDIDILDFDRITMTESRVSVTRQRLEQIKRRKLTAEQIDNLLDDAEREIDKNNEASDDRRSRADVNSERDRTEVTFFEYMETVSVLGRVLKNSEFDEADLKISSAKLHITSCADLLLFVVAILNRLLRSSALNTADAKVSQQDLEAMRYLATKSLVTLVSQLIISQVGSEKLFSVFKAVYEDAQTPLFLRLIISMIYIDLGHPDWLKVCKVILAEKSENRFISDLYADRLWIHVNSKPLTDKEHTDVIAATIAIEESLGSNNPQKSATIQMIASAARHTAIVEGKKPSKPERKK